MPPLSGLLKHDMVHVVCTQASGVLHGELTWVASAHPHALALLDRIHHSDLKARLLRLWRCLRRRRLHANRQKACSGSYDLPQRRGHA